MSANLRSADCEKLVDLATAYALQRNLDPAEYLLGIFQPLIRDGMALDLDVIVRYLIKYHKEWMNRNG